MPGARLLQPDQTFKGLSAEEPRVRLTRRELEMLQVRWGAFDQLMGAEQQHVVERRSMGAVRASPAALQARSPALDC